MKSDNTENKLDLAPAEAEEGEIPAVAAAPELPKQKKSKKKLILITVIVVVVLFLLSRMLGGGSGIPMGGNYTAEAAAHRDLSVTVSGTGTIQPIHSSTIVGMVTGDILSDSFEIGDAVEKDQVLYTIDAEAAQTAVEQAQLALQQAQIAYEQASRAAQDLTVSSTVSGQVSSVEVKKGDAVSAGTAVVTVTDNKNMTIKCNFNSADAKNIRAGQSGTVTITSTGETVAATVSNVSAYTAVGAGGTLVQSVELKVTNPGGITGGMAATARVGTYACQSGGTFEYATQTQVLAKAGGTVDAIYVSEGTTVAPGTKLVHLDGADLADQVQNAKLSLENAQLNLRSAQDALEEYNIKAPISGTVTQKSMSAGDNIGQVGNSTLAIISDLSALTFDMNIDELDISKVKVGQRVRITVDALPGQEFSGYIDKININGTTTGGATSYPVTVMVENPDPSLLPGMNVSADIMVEEVQDALTIPLGAVDTGNTVQVIPASAISEKDGSIDTAQAETRTVELGVSDSSYVEVKDGLKEGDLVLVKSDLDQVLAGDAGTAAVMESGE